MSQNQDLAREIDEYWSRAEALLESIAAVMRTTTFLLELPEGQGLSEDQKEELSEVSTNLVDVALAGISSSADQYAAYLVDTVEDRSPLPDERLTEPEP